MTYSPHDPGWHNGGRDQAPYGTPPQTPSRHGVVWALGALVVVLLVALAGVVGFLLASDGEAPSAVPGPTTPAVEPDSPDTGSADTRSDTHSDTGPRAAQVAECDPDVIASEAGIARRNVNVDRCVGEWALAHVYVPPGEPAGDTQYIVSRVGGSWNRYTGIPSSTCRQEAEADGMPSDIAEVLDTCPSSAAPTGDLGLGIPMSRPACDGRGIVVLYSAVTPGSYSQEISSALAQNPDASYLRTDMACPSLRPRDENGNIIYAVYRPSGYTRDQLCADVRAQGPPAYGRWLDTTSDPSALVSC
ncbi:serine/threonine protein kinase [Dietzia sp. PP-33]|uniref:serine/threonine protein kinase n=1 Tax=Dietzia sp. PP-33 TaxID=2957500 RepID=UPI0029B6407E|nr:serine/threonine protein kinase [Dietzia sp. PP-33]MDX2357330.1 serine/threonine protein kinase [Dietzia sp. PP-33]